MKLGLEREEIWAWIKVLAESFHPEVLQSHGSHPNPKIEVHDNPLRIV